jgi:hypothetical protein
MYLYFIIYKPPEDDTPCGRNMQSIFLLLLIDCVTYNLIYIVLVANSAGPQHFQLLIAIVSCSLIFIISCPTVVVG